MPLKKLLIITIALAIITAGIVGINIFFPRQTPAPIDSPINLAQTQQNFNSLTSEAKSGLDPDNINKAFTSSSSSSSQSSSSRAAFTDLKQATLKTFDDQNSYISIQSQDIIALIGEEKIRNLGENVLMYQDLDRLPPNDFYYLKQGENFKYIGRGIATVEKITIDNKVYWFIVQVNLFGVPAVALFNEALTSKTIIPISDRFLYSSIKSVSNEIIVLNVKNGNGRNVAISDFTINLRDYIDKLAIFSNISL